MSELDDLLVRVQRTGAAGADAHNYTVELWFQGGRQVREQVKGILADYRELASDEPHAVAAHGIDLFNRLFSGRLAAMFHRAWATAGARGRVLRLRLALDAEVPALHAVPWELLHFDDSGGISPPRPLAVEPRVAFSRYIESATFDEGEPVAERPLRMLVAISSPNDLDRWGLAGLDKAAEERDLRTRFSAAAAAGQFSIDFLPVASEQALHDAFAESAGEQNTPRGYHVLLYYGHALHHAEMGSRLVLEHAESGRAQLYDGNKLLSLAKRAQELKNGHRLSMVVLVACNSAAVGTGQLNSLAARLVTDSGVPAVLAMQRLVEIALARRFTFHLSEQLLRDGVIDLAVNAARRRVFQPDSAGWATPVLYMRNAAGRLFSPNAQLEYVEHVLNSAEFVRWSGAEFIEVGVLSVAPGQDWRLLRYRPEDAPAAIGALEALERTLSLELGNGWRAEPAGTVLASPETAEFDELPEPPALTARPNLLALIGPPHSGQTTVLRRLTYKLATALSAQVQRPLGLFISLAGYEQQRGANRLERHLAEQARTLNPALGQMLLELFRASPSGDRPSVVFLLDDFDAVPDTARGELAREVASLAMRMPEQRFVLTSAQEIFPGQLLEQAQVLVLQPLSEHQLFRYLRQRNADDANRMYRLVRENRLLALASDPSMLALIYERLAADPQARVTRNQLVQEYLDGLLAGVEPRYRLGDVARESLTALGWHSRWTGQELLPLPELFRVLAQVRRERDYSLEELYQLLREARVLTSVGQHAARFVNPALYAYCAAVALVARPDATERVSDIVTICASPERLYWWEEVLYALAGLLGNPVPLLEQLAAAIRAGSYTHALIAARCLEAMPAEQEARIPARLRAELLDACVLRLRSEREPLVERREQIVIALGRLTHHQVRHELRRILVEKVRSTPSGPRYEYTNVRIAAARALRNIYTARVPPDELTLATQPVATLVLSGYGDQTSLAGLSGARPARIPSLQEQRDDRMLVGVMRMWRKGPAGRAELCDVLRNSPSPPERALAAFALGDLGDHKDRKLLDARTLLDVIYSPSDKPGAEVSEDWQDTMWAAADALTLFEPEQVASLLVELIASTVTVPDSAAQQLAYLAGRVRANDPAVVRWLVKLLISNHSQSVKAKALQSLAWMGVDLPDVQRALDEKQAAQLPSGWPGISLKQLIQDIAAWRRERMRRLDGFEVRLRVGDSDGSPLYLRRKAIEALAWIGDVETVDELGRQFLNWPLELREHWYLAAATIGHRLNATGQVR